MLLMRSLLTKLFYVLVNCYIVISIGKDKKCLDGVCTLITQCPKALENLEKGIFPKICRFEDAYSEPTICCHNFQNEDVSTEILRIPEHVSTEPSDTPVVFPEEKPELSISKMKCKEYALKTCDNILTVSNSESENDVKIFPHTALIGYGENPDIKWKCSGSLISELYILTAARCEHTSYGYAQWIRLGPRISSGASIYTHIEIVQRIIHPDFVHPYSQNDIALFKLKEEVHFDAYIHPICLFEAIEIKPDQLLSVGFSKENCVNSACDVQTNNELQTEELLVTYTELKDIQYCEKIFHGYEELHNGLDGKSSICSSLPQPILEECQGAIGDTLLHEIKTGCPSFYELIGILSAVDHSTNGFACYFLNTTMIYTKVSHFRPWIEKIVWNHT